jgi:hypothetical protein
MTYTGRTLLLFEVDTPTATTYHDSLVYTILKEYIQNVLRGNDRKRRDGIGNEI